MLILLSSSIIAAKELPSIAVLDFKVIEGFTAGQAAVITKKFENTLAQQQRYRMVTRTEIKSIIDERKFQEFLSGENYTAAVEFGEMVKVEKVAVGQISRFGQLYYLSMQIINVNSSLIEKSVQREYQGKLKNLLQLVEEMAFEAAYYPGIENYEEEEPDKNPAQNQVITEPLTEKEIALIKQIENEPPKKISKKQRETFLERMRNYTDTFLEGAYIIGVSESMTDEQKARWEKRKKKIQKQSRERRRRQMRRN